MSRDFGDRWSRCPKLGLGRGRRDERMRRQRTSEENSEWGTLVDYQTVEYYRVATAYIRKSGAMENKEYNVAKQRTKKTSRTRVTTRGTCPTENKTKLQNNRNKNAG